MALWQWLAIGISAAICLSALVGLVIARILGVIATEISELGDADWWTVAALTREVPHVDKPQRASRTGERRRYAGVGRR
jgi:hypothetical protein